MKRGLAYVAANLHNRYWVSRRNGGSSGSGEAGIRTRNDE